MGEKQRVKSVHYFPFFPFFTRRNFCVLAIFVFFLSFLGGALALFCLFLRVGAIANYTCAIADVGVFVTGGCGEVNGFLVGNAFLGGGLGCGS